MNTQEARSISSSNDTTDNLSSAHPTDNTIKNGRQPSPSAPLPWIKKLVQRLSLELRWTRQYDRETARHDVIAGLVSAVIMIPQAAALASLAGMPPQFGIYASIIPVIIAALWGSSRFALTGPNTAVALMISSIIFPFANVGTELYISLVLVLTLMVGLVQITMSAFSMGDFLKFISPAVITAITNAVGILIIVSAGWGLIGVHYMVEWHFITKLNQLAHDVFRPNPYAMSVGVFTLVVGFTVRRYLRKYYLVIAMIAGILFAESLNLLLGEEITAIERLGNINVSFFPFAVPNLGIDAIYVLKQLLIGAFAIAVVGSMQAIVIARSLADRSGQTVDKNKEIMGQGMANTIGSMFFCFAGSSSFNRSVVHYDSGAKTPLAAVFSAIFLAIIVLLSARLISYMPISVMSAVLIMVGWGLINFREFRRIFHLVSEAWIFYITFLSALMFGLTEAIFFGMFSSVFVYLRGVADPQVTAMMDHEGNANTLKLRGHLFFASLSHLFTYLNDINEEDKLKGKLIVDLTEVTYIDWAAIRMLRREASERIAAGGDFVLRILKDQKQQTLGMIEHLGKIGGKLVYA